MLSSASGRSCAACWRSACWRRCRWKSACCTAPRNRPAALTRLRDSGAQRILALPLFPQYCGATTGAAFDAVSAVLRGWRRLPDVQFVAGYHDHPGYIDALRASVAEHWQTHGRTAHLLMSFHGIPERNVRAGDPYLSQWQNTARLLGDELRLREGEWSVSFSRASGRRAG